MRLGIKLVVGSSLLLGVLQGALAFAASPAQRDLKDVLQQLDQASANFRSTSANFEFDTIETDPVYDKEVQTGAVYYERNGKAFQMGVHIVDDYGKPSPKVYTYGNGTFKLFEPAIDQVTTYTKANKFESYVMLGFGASGTDLQAKWDIKYLGSETVMDGKTSIKTDKLEMVAKDPDVRKNLPKVTIWVDPERAVSLKQLLNFSDSITRVSIYSNIKVNRGPIPSDAFSFSTDKKTQFRNQ